MQALIPIRHDLYSIADRLKEVDERYELFFNAAAQRYEVYASGEMQLAVPSGELDARLIARVRETRVERADAVLAKIERANEAARMAAERAAAEKAAAVLDL